MHTPVASDTEQISVISEVQLPEKRVSLETQRICHQQNVGGKSLPNVCKPQDRNHVCACQMAFRNPRPMLKHWPLARPPRPFAKSYRRCSLNCSARVEALPAPGHDLHLLSKRRLTRLQWWGVPISEAWLCSFKTHFNFRCCNSERPAPPQYQSSEVSISLLAWAKKKKKKGMETNEMLLYLF